MGNPFKIELYRVIVSLGVGFITIFLFVFSFNLYEVYANKYSDKQTLQVSQDSLETKNEGNNHAKENNKGWAEVGLKDIKTVTNETMVFVKGYILPLLLLSIMIGELFSTIGIIVIIELFEKPLDGGMLEREIYVDRDVKWKSFKELFHAFDSNSGILPTLSELHFSLAKGFAGIYVAFVILNFTTIFIFFPFSDFPVYFKILYPIIANILSIHFLVYVFVTLKRLNFNGEVVNFNGKANEFVFIKCLKKCLKYELLSVTTSTLRLIIILIFITMFLINSLLLCPQFYNLPQLIIPTILHSLYAILGIISFMIAVYDFRFANQMLYLALSKPK